MVVATRNRASRLATLLGALGRQSMDASVVEVIVVDDASTDTTAAQLAGRVGPGPELRVLRNPRRLGPAASRNRGWRDATAPVVVFTDDDCRPEEGWLDALLAAMTGGVAVVQGRTVPDPGHGGRRGPFSHTVQVDRFTHRFETCNIAYRRDVFDTTGGFDESFPGAYGEDIDLGWRAVAGGAGTVFAHDAIVFHEATGSDPLARLRQAGRVGALAAVVARHPGYREFLHARVLTDRSHGWAVLAAAGLLVSSATRRPGPIAGALPYLVHRSLTAPLWQRWKSPVTIPVMLVVDLAEVASLARASLRHRTVVL